VHGVSQEVTDTPLNLGPDEIVVRKAHLCICELVNAVHDCVTYMKSTRCGEHFFDSCDFGRLETLPEQLSHLYSLAKCRLQVALGRGLGPAARS